jgi:hypothetical protein
MFGSSPGLFAACHVLRRLLAPRHPPYALISLVLMLALAMEFPRFNTVFRTLRTSCRACFGAKNSRRLNSARRGSALSHATNVALSAHPGNSSPQEESPRSIDSLSNIHAARRAREACRGRESYAASGGLPSSVASSSAEPTRWSACRRTLSGAGPPGAERALTLRRGSDKAASPASKTACTPRR